MKHSFNKGAHREYRVNILLLEEYCRMIDIPNDEFARCLDGGEFKTYCQLLSALKRGSDDLLFYRTLAAIFNYGCNVNALLHNSKEKSIFAENTTGKRFQRRFYRRWKNNLPKTVADILERRKISR